MRLPHSRYHTTLTTQHPTPSISQGEAVIIPKGSFPLYDALPIHWITLLISSQNSVVSGTFGKKITLGNIGIY
jgi:hypothetical protein